MSKLRTIAKRGSIALLAAALLGFSNCAAEISKLSPATQAFIDDALSRATDNPAAFPKVTGIDSDNLGNYTDGNGDTWNVVRFIISFNLELDANTVTTSNIFARDVHDGAGTPAMTTFDGELTLGADGKTVWLQVEVCTAGGSCPQSADDVNEIIVTKAVTATNGNALRGNNSCDTDLCPDANDFYYAWDDTSGDWATDGNPPTLDGSGYNGGNSWPDGADDYIPNDVSYNGMDIVFGGITNSQVTVTVTGLDFDATNNWTDGADLDVFTASNGSVANTDFTSVGGQISADITGLSANSEVTVSLNTGHANFRTEFTYPDGSRLTKTMFVDRMVLDGTNGLLGESDFTRKAWTLFDTSTVNSGSTPQVGLTQQQTDYVYVGGEQSSDPSKYLNVGWGSGDYYNNGGQMVYLGPGSGSHVNIGDGGDGTHCYDSGTYDTTSASNGGTDCGNQYEISNATLLRFQFNQLMKKADLTADKVAVFTQNNTGDSFILEDVVFHVFDIGNNTYLELTTESVNGITGVRIAASVEDRDDGMCLDGNADDTLQCASGDNIDSDLNGRVDDNYYWGTVPTGY